MIVRSIKILILTSIMFWSLAGSIPSASAQGPCGTVDTIDYPLDPAQYGVVYEYGVPSSRYDGRYHAGEDWFGSRTATYGTPVRAIAKGRVTYSAPLGWGLDKGVVILEHLMPDGTWWYSMYGHMEEVAGNVFPAVYTCVNQGDIIGAIGRPRPAPHLHFEIRNFGPDSPGPGYWGTDPVYSGWRNPSKFIQNWQAWLDPALLWHADIADESGPHYPAIFRPDNVTIVFDDGRLKALNPAGQILWRYVLPETFNIVGVLSYEDSILVVDYGGTIQRWSLEGGFVEQWQIASDANNIAFAWQNLLIVHNATTQELIAYGPDQAERWRVADVPRPVSVAQTPAMLGIASRNALTLVGLDGRVYDRATLRATADLAPAPDGGFIVRSQSALWQVDTAGTWRRLADTPTANRLNSALYSLPDGRFFLYASHTLHAYDAGGGLLWALEFSGQRGQPFLLEQQGALLAADGYGHIDILNPATGATCAGLDVWGTRAAGAWAGPGPDGVLRVHIADQVVGLDWAALTAGCAP